MTSTLGPLKSWSHSRLAEFEKCKFKVWLKNVERVAEPERPLPPGKMEHANDRGSRVHDECEQYVDGRSDYLPAEAERHFGCHLDLLRLLYAENKVSLEGEWGMDRNWEPTDWAKAWHRCKLDAIVFLTGLVPHESQNRLTGNTHMLGKSAIVIDYKTGKKWGNEIKHGEQMQLYLLNSFLRFPELEHVRTELWYLDLGETTVQEMTRSQALHFKANFDRRGHAVTSCTKFPPNPNKFSCRWCMYGTFNGGTGHCTVGVDPDAFNKPRTSR